MSTPSSSLPGGTWKLGDSTITRFGYGAMQLAGPGVMGDPADPAGALDVLQAVIEAGINHLDTSFAYGPRVTNELIHKALFPYPEALFISTKVGAERDEKGGWNPARKAQDIREQVQLNLQTLGVESLDLVNMRMGDAISLDADSLAEPFSVLAQLQQEGLIRNLGVSNVSAAQVREAQSIAHIVCVQNMYNLAIRHDDELIDQLAAEQIAYVPFFPLGGFSPLQSDILSQVAQRLEVRPMAVALAWLLERSPNILLIPGTSSVAHLRENIEGTSVVLSQEDIAELDRIGSAAVSTHDDADSQR